MVCFLVCILDLVPLKCPFMLQGKADLCQLVEDDIMRTAVCAVTKEGSFPLNQHVYCIWTSDVGGGAIITFPLTAVH